MKKIFLFTIIFPATLFSKNIEFNNYLIPESISWESLKTIQADVIDKADVEYFISPQCFQDMESYKDFPYLDFAQNILWTTYTWRRYLLNDGLYCTVLINNFGDTNESLEILSTIETKVLLSASKGIGFEEKNFYNFSENLNYINSKVKQLKMLEYTKSDNIQNKSSFSYPAIVEKDINSTTIKYPQYNDVINYNTEIVEGEKAQSVSRYPVSRNLSHSYPYYNMAETVALKHDGGYAPSTSFMFSYNTAVAPKHGVYPENIIANRVINRIAAHNHSGHYGSEYPDLIATNVKSVGGNLMGGFDNNDYALLRFIDVYIVPQNMLIVSGYSLEVGDYSEHIGYPHHSLINEPRNMFYNPSYIKEIFTTGGGTGVVFDGNDPFVGGQSGSPFFGTGVTSDAVFGIGVVGLEPPRQLEGVINYFNNYKFQNIYNWAKNWNPTADIQFSQGIPSYGGIYNLTDVEPFNVAVDAINRMKLDGTIIERGTDLDSLVEWESNIDGNFGNGATVSEDQLKASLSAGIHLITAKIDSKGEQGEANIYIEIIRPTGSFTSPSMCIINIANPMNNTCPINISWRVDDTPETSVVWNETKGSQFATGNSGTKTYLAKTSNTQFKLYPSNQRKILLDTTNVSAKLPTADLSIPPAICALNPSPLDPHTGQYRDPKATPPGCGTVLSWSNVKWASPSVFYKHIGTETWVHLYQIPCKLNGEVCSGSIHTDDIYPELISETGTEFKLLQFDDPNSGAFVPPFTVTGYRYADVYEYDNGNSQDFYFATGATLPPNYEFSYDLTTQAHLNVPQHVHSFHTPVDYDTIQVPLDILGGFEQGQKLKVTVFNKSEGLNVDIRPECAGIYTANFDQQGAPPDPRTETRKGSFPFFNSPRISQVIDPVTGNTEMVFSLKASDTDTKIAQLDLDCTYNRIRINRLAGTPSENLTYSVVVEEYIPESTQVTLNSAETVCNNNYCIRLLGSNFDADASVDVRENTNGSSVIAQFSGNDIYNRTPYLGFDRIQFPIQNLKLQKKLNSNGLCFKVVNNNASSNEQCIIRPTTPPQPTFMGKTVEKYKPQDVEHTSYFVTGNDGNGGGNKLKIMGNIWKKISYDYNVTPNTYLRVDFKSTQQIPEINGVGFLLNGDTTVAQTKVWQFQGIHVFGNQSTNNYSGGDWVTYEIPIGQSFTGQISDMVFIADEDNHVGQNVVFKNPELYQEGLAIDEFEEDDTSSTGKNYLGQPQLHNFVDDTVDWVNVWMTGAGTMTYFTSGLGTNADTCLDVYFVADLNTPVASNCDYNNTDESRIDVNINAAGTYLVKITNENNLTGLNTEYTFTAQWSAQQSVDEYEDDDTSSSGSNYLGQPQHHNFADDSVDWVNVWMTGAGTMTYYTSGLGSNADTCLDVYFVADLNTPVASNCDYNNTKESRIYANIDSAGTYLIKITNINNVTGSNTDYTFTAQYSATVLTDTYEEDDTSATGKNYVGQPQQHDFLDDGVDWVNVWMSGAGTMTYFTTGLGTNADTCLDVYFVADLNTPVASNCDYNNTNESRIEANINAAGTYLVKITNENNLTGPNTEYTFTAQWAPN